MQQHPIDFNQTIDRSLFHAIKLTAKNSYFERIQSILVYTNIEKPPNFFLAERAC